MEPTYWFILPVKDRNNYLEYSFGLSYPKSVFCYLHAAALSGKVYIYKRET